MFYIHCIYTYLIHYLLQFVDGVYYRWKDKLISNLILELQSGGKSQMVCVLLVGFGVSFDQSLLKCEGPKSSIETLRFSTADSCLGLNSNNSCSIEILVKKSSLPAFQSDQKTKKLCNKSLYFLLQWNICLTSVSKSCLTVIVRTFYQYIAINAANECHAAPKPNLIFFF